MNFEKFLREPFLHNTSGRLLLEYVFWYFINGYLERLEGVITCYCASIPTQIVFNRSFDWHVSDRVQNDFSFDNF